MYKILIAPGHDQEYNVFRDHAGKYTNEAKENLRWCLNLYEKLQGQPGVQCDISRRDSYVRQSMDDKKEMADGYDLYLSVHSNAGNGSSTGAFMFCDVNPNYQDKDLAKAILDAHCKANGIANRGLAWIAGPDWTGLSGPSSAYDNYFYELRGNSASAPMLFERFFHDNASDVAKSTTDKAVEASTRAVADVIVRMKGSETAPVETTPDPVEKTEIPATKDEAVKLAGEFAKKYYVPGKSALPSVMAAQILLETGYMTSELFKNANNPAGIKYSAPYTNNYDFYEKVSPEWINGSTQQISSKFVKFNSIEDGVKAMAVHMVSTPARAGIYSKVLNGSTYQAQAEGLSSTWATDPSYGAKLIEIIKRYYLTQYDPDNAQGATQDPVKEEVTITISKELKPGTYVIKEGK